MGSRNIRNGGADDQEKRGKLINSKESPRAEEGSALFLRIYNVSDLSTRC